MIYPPTNIDHSVVHAAIQELYPLHQIQVWNTLAFAEKYNVVITTHEDIEKLAESMEMIIAPQLRYKHKLHKLKDLKCPSPRN